MSKEQTERNGQIITKALGGDTLSSIASEFKISIERVRQILQNNKVNTKEIRKNKKQ